MEKNTQRIITKAHKEEEEEVEMTRKSLLALDFSSKIQTSQMAKSVSVHPSVSVCEGGGRFFFFWLISAGSLIPLQ